MAIHIARTWARGNHFCATPLNGSFELGFIAIILFICFACALDRYLKTRKNAVPPAPAEKHRVNCALQ
jgi:hypothetical protein